MKIITPDYYDRFACIKGDCRHSCCVGWEIDIDSQSLQRFYDVPGELGAHLRANIVEGEDGACFRLTEGDRCPFLNTEGLCDLILELGEDCLCQICDDHPRFRNFFSDREEIGLGLCCEAAGRLILGKKESAYFVETEDELLMEELTEEEAELLQLRGELIAMAQDRSKPITLRVREMLAWLNLDLQPFVMEEWKPFLLGLERLDPQWTARLEDLTEETPEAALARFEVSFEQLLVYLLWRHLPGALEDGDLSGRIAYVCFAWWLVRRMCAARQNLDFEELVEICRLYSSELEYSDENIGAIIDRIHECNPEV